MPGGNVAIFGGFGERPLVPGWTRERAVAVFGGGELDLRSAPPGENTRLTAVAVLGGVEIKVAPGTRVTISSLSFLGGRDVKIERATARRSA